MATIVHFEVPVDDVGRARKFYSELFGWEIKDSGMPGGEYWSVVTTGENPVHGGMMKRQQPQQQITNFIDVASVDEYVAKVDELGGSVVVSKSPVPGEGYFAVCLDTENNGFGIWEEDKDAK
jgi:predicted enzyme related to lactoylglutathione lyase